MNKFRSWGNYIFYLTLLFEIYYRFFQVLIRIYFILLLFITLAGQNLAQTNLTVGRPFEQIVNPKGAYYDLSDPSSVNMKVHIWGNVQFPGLYLISEKTTVMELISMAGGPQASAYLDDMRIFRMNADSTYEMIKFNYNDLLWNDKLTQITPAPKLLPGDIILLPGEPRLYWREYLSLGLSVISTLLSITLSIIYITN